MAGKYIRIEKSMLAPVKKEDRRQIPLTAFTLLTVPEEPMLFTYLRTKDTVDVSLVKRMSGANLDKSLSSPTGPESSKNYPLPSCTNEPFVNRHKLSSKLEASRLDLDLDKFMASVTANESPDAVIRTIISAKASECQLK